MGVLLAVLGACLFMGLVVIAVLLLRVLGAGALAAPRPGTDDEQPTEPVDTQQAAERREQAELEAAELIRRAEETARAVQERAESESALRASLAEAQAHELGRKSAETFRVQAEAEVRQLRSELHAQDARLVQREQRLEVRTAAIDEQARQLETRDHDLAAREAEVARRRAELVDLEEERRQTLETVARLTAAQARAELVKVVEADARRDAAVLIRDIEAQAREQGEDRARKIVTLAIQRVASEATTESVVSVLHLPNDEMKGRIIGREGRNIRSFEAVTGVNVIIDDTPEAVLLSCFDPVRREVGKITLEALVSDGRIHPHRIE
ncbi:Rnase Y domain-containing protein, partial [Frankia sp. Cas4]|uniref:Rnase Y domain-containing protein n=1 Tax=Frankia sp. Cas4 TaxID=3073927 RepID=UPI002AD2FFF7